MKKFFLLLCSALALLPSLSFAIQNIDCRIADDNTSDHVLVSLATDQLGTFFMNADIEEDGNPSAVTKLPMKRLAPITKDMALFSATAQIPEGAGTIQFKFQIPEALILKAATDFKGVLGTRISELDKDESQDLICTAKIQ